MARKTVRVDIPADAGALVKLTDTIATKHTELGAASPIKTKGLVQFLVNVPLAKALHLEIEKLQAELQEKIGQRDQLIGIADGQTSHTEGTILFETMAIRDVLLGVYRGNENTLETWGFPVSVGTAKSPVRKAKAAGGA